jgi:hypothetical protein
LVAVQVPVTELKIVRELLVPVNVTVQLMGLYELFRVPVAVTVCVLVPTLLPVAVNLVPLLNCAV